jgi:hypothetical protein
MCSHNLIVIYHLPRYFFKFSLVFPFPILSGLYFLQNLPSCIRTVQILQAVTESLAKGTANISARML